MAPERASITFPTTPPVTKLSAALKTLAPVRQLQMATVAIPLGKINNKMAF